MKKNSRKGFTLVEMIVVIAIIGILAAILIPTLVGFIGKANKDKSRAEAEAAWLEYTNNCKNKGLSPSETFVYKAEDGTYYEVDTQGNGTVTDKRNVTDLTACNGGISYVDPSENVSSNSGGEGGPTTSLSDEEIINRRVDLGGIYSYTALENSITYAPDSHKDIGNFTLNDGNLRQVNDKNADKGVTTNGMTFSYNVTHYQDDNLTFQVNKAATPSYQITYYNEDNEAEASPQAIQIGEKSIDNTRKVVWETDVYYKQIYYAMIEIGLVEDDSAEIKAEMVDEKGNATVISDVEYIVSSGKFTKVLFATDNKNMGGRLRITINKNRDMYNPIFIKSIEFSSKKYSTGTIIELDEPTLEQYRSDNLNASTVANNGDEVTVTGTVTFIDVNFLSGNSCLFYVQTLDAAMAVYSSSQQPKVGSYVKISGTKDGATSWGDIGNLFTGASDVKCGTFTTVAMSNGPKVVSMDLTDIDYNLNAGILPKEGVDVGKKITVNEKEVPHRLMNYSLVNASELTIETPYHKVTDSYLLNAYHYEFTARNSKGQIVPFYIHNRAINPNQEAVVSNLNTGDKFTFEGGVLFNYNGGTLYQSTSKTFVKLSYEKSKIAKI